MSSVHNFLTFTVSVVVVAVISRVAKMSKILESDDVAVSMTIKGFLMFFALSLIYFPVSLMLGGVQNRNKFFQRE